MKAPLVSIISVSYNQEKYIRQTLEGFVSQQTDFNFEIVIADDCSSDKTPQIIKEFTKKYPDLFKANLRKENVGVLPNFLSVMRAARGKYIAVCEGDDYWTDSQKLQKQVDFLEANPEYTVCFHPVKVVVEGKKQKSYISPDPLERELFDNEELLRRNYIQTNSVMYRRQSYDEMPDYIMPVDWYLHMYHAYFGKIGFIDEVMSVYRRHAGGIWSESYDDMNDILARHGVGWLGVHIYAMRLYSKQANDKGSLAIIKGSVITAFNRLAEVDRKRGTSLISEALVKFPDGAQVFIEDLIDQRQQLEEHSKEQAKIIKHYLDMSDSLSDRNRHLESRPLVKLEDNVRRRLKGKS